MSHHTPEFEQGKSDREGGPVRPVPVGFIGLGDQGLPMAIAVAEAGYPLHVWARYAGSLDQLGQMSHVPHTNIDTLASACEVVALCVGTDDDVFKIVEGGLLAGMRDGSIIVNHGTGTPRNALHLSELCAAAGVTVLDAPVSGGRAGAEAKTLTTMVGGPLASFEYCEPLFRSFSAHVVHLGGPGAGQGAKLLNNALMILNQASIVEVANLGAAFGIDPRTLVEVLNLGSAASRMLSLLNIKMRPETIADTMEHTLHVLALDMEIFATAVKEQGMDASAITARGLAGIAALPDLVYRLNPTPES